MRRDEDKQDAGDVFEEPGQRTGRRKEKKSYRAFPTTVAVVPPVPGKRTAFPLLSRECNEREKGGKRCHQKRRRKGRRRNAGDGSRKKSSGTHNPARRTQKRTTEAQALHGRRRERTTQNRRQRRGWRVPESQDVQSSKGFAHADGTDGAPKRLWAPHSEESSRSREEDRDR